MNPKFRATRSSLQIRRSFRIVVTMLMISLLTVSSAFVDGKFARSAGATNAYANLSSGSFSFSVNAGNANQITANDDWSGVASVEGYDGNGLTGSAGVDPQTVLGTGFAGDSLPGASDTQVNANKGNPSAYNAGGVTEFDTGDYLAIGLQGNVQSNPSLVFYMNSLGRGPITMSYDIIDIDAGSNSAVSPVALQYRIGTTGSFTNVPAGYVADATDGPTIGGRVTSRSVQLPSETANKVNVQIRLITTNGAGPDEWIGVNNVVFSSLSPSSASVEISGRAVTPKGTGISRAIVTMTNSLGQQFTTMTNSFGYYHFREVSAGSTIIIEARAKGYTFDTQVVTAFDSISDLDLVATE
jgi:hypothetical protein